VSVKFSIVTPSFNQLSWLKLCAASIADQSDAGWEYIVQDACSTDGTQEWLATQSRVKAFVEIDSGMYDAVNRGWRKASGDIIAYLNCDEQYLPGALKTVEEFFQKNPNVDVAFADTIVTDANGDYICHRCALKPIDPLMWISFPVLTCAIFMRRQSMERAGITFDTKWRDVGDFFFVREIVRKLRVAVLPRFTSVFAWTGANMSQKPNAVRENELKMQMAPRWVGPLKYPITAHNRLRLAMRGAFFRKPFDYAIYTMASPDNRVTRRAEKPTALLKSRLPTTSASA